MDLSDIVKAKAIFAGGGSGGGETWNTVFEGNVTTEEPAEAPWAVIPNTAQITADNIRVTFNGTEYECEKNVDGTYGALLDESTETYDWSVYPFNIGYDSGDESMTLITQTAGTYSLKIEEPQSEGSSDFSTAEVTFVNNTVSNILSGSTALVFDEEEHSYVYGIDSLADNGSYTFILYKGLNIFQCTNTDKFTVTTSGNVTYDSEHGAFLITGDCTITIS